jgi:hypothetical protein
MVIGRHAFERRLPYTHLIYYSNPMYSTQISRGRLREGKTRKNKHVTLTVVNFFVFLVLVWFLLSLILQNGSCLGCRHEKRQINSQSIGQKQDVSSESVGRSVSSAR